MNCIRNESTWAMLANAIRLGVGQIHAATSIQIFSGNFDLVEITFTSDGRHRFESYADAAGARAHV